MAPLTKNVHQRNRLGGDDHDEIMAPANAGSVFFVGAYLCREAATGVVIPATDAADVVPLGVCLGLPVGGQPADGFSANLDNTDGSDGVLTGNTHARCVLISQRGHWAFTVTGADTPKVGNPAYIVDDNTVTADAPGVGEASVNGIIAGWFDRPAPTAGQWFINIAYRGLTAAAGA